MMNLLGKFVSNITSHSSSFFAGFIGDYASAGITNIVNGIFEFLLQCAWSVISFIMTIMDALEYVAFSFLGINMGVNDFSAIEEKINLDVLTNTYRALFGIAIVFMLIFTIVAIVRQEWSSAASGFVSKDKKGKVVNGVSNPKMPFITRLLRNFVIVLIMPLLVFFMFAGVTSVLNSFNMAIKQNQHSTIAGQVLASSTYDANKYRMYANLDQRIPIIINAYDSGEVNYDNIDDMAIKISSLEVQSTLKDLASKMINKTFGSYASTLVQKNNTIYNNEDYSLLHEKFICTPEQYHVMADFVDYAQQSGVTYYIKSIDDEAIEWKYVSSAVYKQSSNELVVEYVNASVANNGNYAKAASIDDVDKYTITYCPTSNVTSPISDALESIKAMLGLGEYGENLYNVMDRQDGFSNLVSWANEKALLKLSDNFDLEDKTTWTDTDEILIYEYYRWKYNNSLRDYSIDDLKKGIEWDVKLVSYREYYDKIDMYSDEKYHYCICLNKNYYIVHQDELQTDMFGNSYYVLTSHANENFAFLEKEYTMIEENATINIGFSSSTFDINKINDWTPQDQIILYEYYLDESYRNSLRQYNIEDFKRGVNLPRFKITNYNSMGSPISTSDVVLLNNTYYSLQNGKIDTNGKDLLTRLDDGKAYVYYHYFLDELKFATYAIEKYGLQNDLNRYINTANSASSFQDLNIEDPTLQDKTYADFTLKLSSNFSYSDITTWSFRDILIFYLYQQGYGFDIEYLKNMA